MAPDNCWAMSGEGGAKGGCGTVVGDTVFDIAPGGQWRRVRLSGLSALDTCARSGNYPVSGTVPYYVVIGGRRFPVKQLFAEATGLRRAEFITDDAFRIFRKLGFDVEEFGRPSGVASGVAVAERPISGELRGSKFAVSLEADEDGYIVASRPQLPGCHSQGRTRE